MFLTNHNVATIRRPFLEAFAALALCCALLLTSTAAESADSDDIIVTRVNGDVRVTSNGAPHAAKAGSALELPALIRTGRDGSIELQQGQTTVSVGPDTQLDFPAVANRGDPLDRIVQPLGNVFYNVGKRESRKLRVETPYLVAVIKGTQFNVVAQPDSTTISLFEGRLEVRATDESDVVDLKAGEIAMRHAGDKAIRVLRMDTGKPPATAPDSERGTPPGTGLAPRPDDDGAIVPRAPSPLDDDVDNLAPGRPINGDGTAGANVNLGHIASAQLNAGIDAAAGGFDAGAGAALDLGAASVDAGLDTRVDLGAGTVDAGVSAGVEVGPASVDLGVDAGVDLGAGRVDLGTDVGVDIGAASIDAGVDAAVDLGAGTVDAAVDVGADLGVAAVDVGLDAGADLGAGTVDVAADAGVDLGIAAVDAGLDAGVDLSAPAVDVGADVGADLGLVDADLGLDAGVDAGAGAIDAGVDTSVAGVDVGVDLGVDPGAGLGLDVGLGGLDVGLDLGLGQEDTTAPDTTDTGGGLLDGLLRRPGRN